MTARVTPTNVDEHKSRPGGVIAESVRESVEAAGQFTFERTLEWAADAVHPGAGRVISIALKVKEVLDDAEALASPDKSRNLHVPLLNVTGGLTVDLNVHLPGTDGAGDDAPPVSGFLSPGDDGLFGGWEIEVDQPSESDEKDASASDQDARPTAEQAERSLSQKAPAPPVIDDDLSLVKRRVKDSRRRVVVLRETAWRLRTQLYARREFATKQILVIYDPLAGLGMWLVNPGLSDGLAGRHIVLDLVARSTIEFIE